MDCGKAQESVLDSLGEPLEAGRRQAMEDHLIDCRDCRRFAEVQHALDARLAAAVPAAGLSAGFRASLRTKTRRDPESAWPDFLPELAHLAGCSIAVTLSVFLVPLPADKVILAGVAFTGLTYSLQTGLRTLLDEP